MCLHFGFEHHVRNSSTCIANSSALWLSSDVPLAYVLEKESVRKCSSPRSKPQCMHSVESHSHQTPSNEIILAELVEYPRYLIQVCGLLFEVHRLEWKKKLFKQIVFYLWIYDIGKPPINMLQTNVRTNLLLPHDEFFVFFLSRGFFCVAAPWTPQLVDIGIREELGKIALRPVAKFAKAQSYLSYLPK